MSVSENQLQPVTVKWTDRWLVYQRLQELSIPCQCNATQPLRAQIDSPLAALQLWSISQQLNASREQLVEHLQRCWAKFNESDMG